MATLASKGLGLSSLTGRQTSSHFAAQATRSIHTPAGAIPRGLPHPQLSTGGTVNNLVRQTRNFLSRFITHLTTPGFSHPIVGRSIHTGVNAARQPSIQQRLSLPARQAFSRQFGGPRLPQPATVPRNTIQVGLGTARNFSTARPIFQSLAENVPIAGRTIYEADCDLKKRKGSMKHKIHNEKENQAVQRPQSIKIAKDSGIKSSLEHYFPAEVPALPVSTYMLIPLAPTPTSRFPLLPSSQETLLPLSAIVHLHTTYGTHSARISSLFSRLDAARVWDRGASCSAYGDRSGLCTVLKVEFKGWTKEMVRGVIGEAGKGWCEIEEIRDETMSEIASEVGSNDSRASLGSTSRIVDPAQTVILPTLDVSSPNVDHAPTYTRSHSASSSCSSASPPISFPPSPALTSSSMGIDTPSFSDLDSFTDWEEDNFTDNGSQTGSWVMTVPSSIQASSAGTVLGFSSDFLNRV